jgi:probable addiction module antidote protein
VLAEKDSAAFLIALKDVVEAGGGVAHLAGRVGLKRSSLYKILSKTGNPTSKTLQEILKPLGLPQWLWTTRHEGKLSQLKGSTSPCPLLQERVNYAPPPANPGAGFSGCADANPETTTNIPSPRGRRLG